VPQESESINLTWIVGFLRRRLALIAFCCVAVTAAAYFFSKHQTKQYTATASLVFNNNPLSQELVGLPANSGNLLVQEAGNLQAVQLGDMAAVTARVLGHGLTEESVRRSLAISGLGESSAVAVAATSHSPSLAAAMANTYVAQFVKEQQGLNRQFFTSALALVNRQLAALPRRERTGAASVALQNRAQSLRFLSDMQSGNVRVAQQALLPSKPSSPKISRNTILGLFIGLLLGLGLALTLERLDRARRITEPRELEAIYRAPLLGVIPQSRSLSGLFGRARGGGTLSAEMFPLIRAHLRSFNGGREPRTIIIASAASGEGRTTVAQELARAAAQLGSRTLLLEADLRHPVLAAKLDLTAGAYLPEVLAGDVSIEEASRTLPLEAAPGGDSGRTLDVLAAGLTPTPNPGALMESPAMDSLLEQARATYDLVVIDSPPLGVVSDAFALLKKVDGVVIVANMSRGLRGEAARLHEIIAASRAPLLGVIANGDRGRGATVGRYSPPSPEISGGPKHRSGDGNGAVSREDLVSPTARV
jgi:capsular exopolysaccharide synthesis family protein